jgi:hypothetical protein
MKKIITLFFCLGAVTAAFAQTAEQDEARRVILSGGGAKKTDQDTRNSRDVILGGERRVYDEDDRRTSYPYPGNYPTSGSRQSQVDQVNRDYDAKIRSIRNNRELSSAEKDRIIRDLNNDRSRVIRQINGRYESNNRRYDDDRDRRYDDDDRKDKKYKSNNGNHYGWEKGKGNPHKSGNSKGKNKGKGKN